MSIVGGMASGIELLLKVLDNPGQYRTKLDEIRAAADEADALIALAGPASEIPALRKQAEEDMEKAKATANRAVVEADHLCEKANAQASRIVGEAQSKAQALMSEAEGHLDRAKVWSAQSSAEAQQTKANNEELRKIGERMIQRETALITRETAVAERESEVELERARLAEVAQRFQASLG